MSADDSSHNDDDDDDDNNSDDDDDINVANNLNINESNEVEVFPDSDLDIFDYDTCTKESSIKAASPFTAHFQNIYLQVTEQIEQTPVTSNATLNKYHLPEFVYLLNSRFMPYCFIWASFVLRNMDTEATRWTNGSMESFIGTRKNKEKSFLKLSPAAYALQTFGLAKGGCLDFYLRPQKKDKRKREAVVEHLEEVATFDAVDEWSKRPVKSDLIRIGKKKKEMGFYQAKVAFNDISDEQTIVKQPVINEGIHYRKIYFDLS